ncbi:MAG: haloacid dehalogenase-like hydrolase [Phycisphaerales bacterium]
MRETGAGVLILFDIDMTLVATDGAGFRAMLAAGRELFGESFTGEGVSFGGRLDPAIIADLLRVSGVEPTPRAFSGMREGYVRYLSRTLSREGVARALPGTRELVEALLAEQGVTLGVLTGNFPESGELKLRAAGFDPVTFRVRVWGCDSPHEPPERHHLPPIAIKRYEQEMGEPIPGERVVVVGDTVHDVTCGRANGCRTLGVATGYTTREGLVAAGADLVLDDLRDTAGVVRWLLG